MNLFPILFPFLVIPFIGGPTSDVVLPAPTVLASHEFSLEKRYGNQYVNDVFKDNILLTIDLMRGDKIDASKIDWKQVEKPFTYTLTLQPSESFSFHDDVLPEFKNKISKTTNAHFSSDEGFKSDGWLVGDGVCHLASLMYWVAKDAGLDAVAPTRHDFAPVPEVPREFGTAIYEVPNGGYTNEAQNLYITNNQEKTVNIVFNYNGTELKITVEK